MTDLAPRVSLITLGVADVARATVFYEALGWVRSSASQPSVTFLHGQGGAALALWGRADLAEDACLPDEPGGFRAVSLAHNLENPDAVDAFFARALAAGATATRPPGKAFWGGYLGYFTDPDGHLWEVAHNPFWPLDARGFVELPP